MRTPGTQQRLEALENRRAGLEAEIAATEASAIPLHPNLAQLFIEGKFSNYRRPSNTLKSGMRPVRHSVVFSRALSLLPSKATST